MKLAESSLTTSEEPSSEVAARKPLSAPWAIVVQASKQAKVIALKRG
jgi:hypothetical protein